MKQGERIPPRIREFIVKTMRNAPELSYGEIALKVESQYGVEIDKTTVGRIWRREGKPLAGMPRSEALPSPPQETWQPTLEAQKRHFAAIRRLLLDWQDELTQQSRFVEAGLRDTSPAKVEAKRLFPCVLEHCPLIRNTYDELAKRRHIYEERWTELESEIRPPAPPKAVEAFAKTVMFYALSVAEGNSGPSYYVDKKWLQIDQGPQRTGIAQGSAKIRKQVRGQHLELVERYSEDQRVLEMVNMKKAILQEQHQLASTLEDSVQRQEYLTASVKCGFCPR
jgi:hypothetical protein